MPKATDAEIEAWILEWLRIPGNFCADALTEPFHEDFFNRFGYARCETNWGAQRVGKAMSVLSAMHRAGKLVRRRISLGMNWQPGWPKSVYSYSLLE